MAEIGSGPNGKLVRGMSEDLTSFCALLYGWPEAMPRTANTRTTTAQGATDAA
jgi:hypothetical protein